MIEATYVTRTGEVRMIYANSFEELFKYMENKDIKEIAGRTISLAELRQGKEKVTNAIV